MKKILVVVDMQEKFIKDISAETIVKNVEYKIKQRVDDNYEIILTFDKSGGNIDGSVLKACKSEKIFVKHSYGSEELISYLKVSKPSTVEFVGICTDICLITNVLTTITFLPFSDIVVDSSCCAAQSDAGHVGALNVMKACKIRVI